MSMPSRAAAKIAGAVEGEDGGFIERGREVGRSGVGVMMIEDDNAARRKAGAQLQKKIAGRDRAHDGDGIHLLCRDAGEFETGGSSMIGKLAAAVPGRLAARDF